MSQTAGSIGNALSSWLDTGRERPNIGSTERTLSAFAGAGLIAHALSRRTLPSVLLAAVGVELLRRGLTGSSHLFDSLRASTAPNDGGTALPRDFYERGIQVEEAITIQRPASVVYAFWRNFENLPRFMSHLQSVTVHDDRRSHWVAQGPAGTSVYWDAEVINEKQDAMIAWTTTGGTVDHRGSVRFQPATGGRGTEIKVVLDYLPPAGKLGHAIAKLFHKDPQSQIRDDLRRLRALLEVGDVPTIDGQSSGRNKNHTVNQAARSAPRSPYSPKTEPRGQFTPNARPGRDAHADSGGSRAANLHSDPTTTGARAEETSL